MISLDKIVKTNVFKVPNNYFEQLTLSIQQQIETEKEPSVNFISKQTFTTPEGYFDNLSSIILSKIDQIEDKKIKLEDLERVNIFQTPDNYFSTLEKVIVIESLDKANIFAVPNGYFDSLTDEIIAKIERLNKGKILKIDWLKSSRLKWSAAASIVLFVGLWFAIPQFSKDKTALALENISKDEIKTYLETQDLSYLEYETALENSNSSQNSNEVLDGLQISKQDILEHLQNQDLEEEI
jgi:hypothetical protein